MGGRAGHGRVGAGLLGRARLRGDGPRSKADQDPAAWLPPAVGYRCTYATDWVADKTRWGLSVDTNEQAALGELLEDWPNIPVTVTLAR